MRAMCLFLSLFLLHHFSSAQNFAVSQVQMPKCYGVCDGKITFTTGAVTGPFTAVVTNSASCPNSTLQTSNANSITIDSICGCNATYSFAIYNASLMLVGTMVQSIINYATGPLAFTVSTVVPATCSNCCDGSVSFSISGGNQMSPPTFSVDGTFTNNVSPLYFQCVGSHTICIVDASGCTKCIPFNMTYTGGFTELKEEWQLVKPEIYPQPALETLMVTSMQQDMLSYSIQDLQGKEYLQHTLSDREIHQFTAKIEALPPGLYFLTIRGQNGGISRTKFIKVTD